MNTLRALLGIIGGTTTGYAIATLLTHPTPRGLGVAVAITSACVLGIYLIRAIQTDHNQ